jgi:hypothetical protein
MLDVITYGFKNLHFFLYQYFQLKLCKLHKKHFNSFYYASIYIVSEIKQKNQTLLNFR